MLEVEMGGGTLKHPSEKFVGVNVAPCMVVHEKTCII
jgi:hypothetical protein